MALSIVLSCNAPSEQMDFTVAQFRDLGADAYHEDGKIFVDCQTEESERAVRDALQLVPKLQ